jgi:hypothetical protein
MNKTPSIIVGVGAVATLVWLLTVFVAKPIVTLEQLGVLFTIWSLVGLLVALHRSAVSQSEMIRAIEKIEEQNRLHLEGLFLQAVAAELNGMGVLFTHARSSVGSQTNEDRMKKMQLELNMAKLRYAGLLGIKITD